jgi:periplasmic divalent cation tolerance protein
LLATKRTPPRTTHMTRPETRKTGEVCVEPIIQVATAVDSRDGAVTIGRHLVECRLAACAQVSGPIKSVYWWKGAMEEAEEWLCTVKSRKSLYGAIEMEIRKIHPYEVPEIVAVDIDGALPEYVLWVAEETGRP